MQLKSRLLVGLVAVMFVLMSATGAFAQININVFPNAIATEINSNRTAEINDFNQSGSGILVSANIIAVAVPVTETRLILSFGVPITAGPAAQVTAVTGYLGSSFAGTLSTAPIPAANNPAATTNYLNIPGNADAIRITAGTGIFGGAGASVVSIYTINFASGIIQIALPEIDNPGQGVTTLTTSSSGSFRITGIRLDTSAVTATSQGFTASLSNTVNNYLLSTTAYTSITAFAAGIAAPTQAAQAAGGTNNGTFTLFTNGTVADSLASLRIGESGVNSFRSTAQYVDGAVLNGSQVRLTFSGLPAGVSLTLGIGSKSSSLTPVLSRTSITTANNTSIVTFTATDLTATESFNVEVTNVTVVAGTTPAAGAITVTASMAPASTVSLDTTVTPNAPINTDGYPRFLANELGPVTLGQIIAANTQLLIPYALVLAPYDTGIAVANTTADPFGGVINGGAAAGSGTITVSFYPTATAGGAGTAFTLTTSSTIKPGSGLSADGTLASGATWTVLMSDLLTAAAKTQPFVGYAFIAANFLNAHGTATISDFRTYSLAANVLVLPPPAVTSRSTGGVESLGN